MKMLITYKSPLLPVFAKLAFLFEKLYLYTNTKLRLEWHERELRVKGNTFDLFHLAMHIIKMRKGKHFP